MDFGDKCSLPELSPFAQSQDECESPGSRVKHYLSPLSSPCGKHAFPNDKPGPTIRLAGMESQAELVVSFIPWFMPIPAHTYPAPLRPLVPFSLPLFQAPLQQQAGHEPSSFASCI